ncbi:MAG: transglycosylase domain-containing protein, partial [Nevskiales bacterium]|nr:transglycosylase domain-containing protein [Nevskiales bacterium]
MTLPRHWILKLLVGTALTGVLAGYIFMRWSVLPGLPPTERIKELRLEEPLRIYTRDGQLIGEFGAERRTPLKFSEFPEPVILAFLAAEDDRFFEHPGVDWRSLVRAGLNLLTTGEKSQGGSTITMQLARNVFLSSERTFTRKAREILLAFQIERDLPKEDILELYLNKIFLGNRAYGVAAAAQVYFGRDVKALTLAQTALLAGLPKAPSRDNPAVNPERAKERRDYVLRRMRALDFISESDYQTALIEPVTTHLQRPPVEVDAHYVAEMVRAELFGQYSEAAYTEGYRVTTTLDSRLQQLANKALRQALREYDERHGYRGPESRVSPEVLDAPAATPQELQLRVDAVLEARPTVVGLWPAVVLEFSPQRLHVLVRGGRIELKPEAFAWARLSGGALARGDVVRVATDGKSWRLAQIPEVQGAFVALDPRTGSLKALVGGYDFFEGKFNRVIQAQRQLGSAFKPFLYSAALKYGFTPASVILDAPVVFEDPALESTWRPENYSGKFYGPTRLREALVHSRNLVSIRLLQAVGIARVREHAALFGLQMERMPSDLTLALGSASFTPLETAKGYAVFANGGFRVEPYFMETLQAPDGRELFRAQPRTACAECPETVPAEPAVESSGLPEGPSPQAERV